MTTAQAWIEEVKRHLLGGNNENMNRLTTTMNTSVTTVVIDFTTIGGIVTGATIEIDLELMFVWSISGANVTVQRAFNGTTAAAHTAGAIITVNPRFPQFSIFTALNAELYDLCSPSSGLFRIGSGTITAANGVVGYDLSLSGYISVYDVHFETSTSAKHWKRIDNWRVIEQADTTDFASGRGIIISDVTGLAGGTIRVTYKRSFSPLTAASDDVATVTGMPVEMHDIPPLGAISRLTVTRGVKRAFDESQGEPRRASEVPEMAMVQNATAILAMRNRRIAAEVSRLNSLYPQHLRKFPA